MFERFRRNDAPDDSPAGSRTAVAERPTRTNGATTADRDDTVVDRPRRGNGTTAATAGTTGLTSDHMRAARARQHDEFGGINWGAAFFGWLVAVGLGAILIGLVAGAGAAIGLTQLDGNDTETVGLGGGIALLVVLMIAYYAGGYVAGRMSRFDGARQGAG